MAFILLLLISATWLLGLMAVNGDVMIFHYLFAVFSCLQVATFSSHTLEHMLFSLSHVCDKPFSLFIAFRESSSSSSTWSLTKMYERIWKTSWQERRTFRTTPAPQGPLCWRWANCCQVKNGLRLFVLDFQLWYHVSHFVVFIKTWKPISEIILLNLILRSPSFIFRFIFFNYVSLSIKSNTTECQ